MAYRPPCDRISPSPPGADSAAPWQQPLPRASPSQPQSFVWAGCTHTPHEMVQQDGRGRARTWAPMRPRPRRLVALRLSCPKADAATALAMAPSSTRRLTNVASTVCDRWPHSVDFGSDAAVWVVLSACVSACGCGCGWGARLTRPDLVWSESPRLMLALRTGARDAGTFLGREWASEARRFAMGGTPFCRDLGRPGGRLSVPPTALPPSRPKPLSFVRGPPFACLDAAMARGGPAGFSGDFTSHSLPYSYSTSLRLNETSMSLALTASAPLRVGVGLVGTSFLRLSSAIWASKCRDSVMELSRFLLSVPRAVLRPRPPLPRATRSFRGESNEDMPKALAFDRTPAVGCQHFPACFRVPRTENGSKRDGTRRRK